ncbi:Bor/Iss family lipoprotein [Candidatus Uabimicrobium amorphum]|uniref:Lipoprotein n=1 Tax=Uabimicrobium amorphum TaxID=2596890 RepID=A0A5S9II42_UABAM|nr:hypothetical protein [Candidatus Uabimicrobium amorphum]BBM82249.1 hypothetical protein UABAM_00592 [Candidatus Uabimicrobium amorphum]
MRKTYFVVLSMLALALTSCQTVKYTADPTPLITFKKVQPSPENFHYSENVDFFLWGITPNPGVVNITQVARNNGAPAGLTNLRIYEEFTLWSWFIGFITLGIYSPRYIEVHGVKIPGGLDLY